MEGKWQETNNDEIPQPSSPLLENLWKDDLDRRHEILVRVSNVPWERRAEVKMLQVHSEDRFSYLYVPRKNFRTIHLKAKQVYSVYWGKREFLKPLTMVYGT